MPPTGVFRHITAKSLRALNTKFQCGLRAPECTRPPAKKTTRTSRPAPHPRRSPSLKVRSSTKNAAMTHRANHLRQLIREYRDHAPDPSRIRTGEAWIAAHLINPGEHDQSRQAPERHHHATPAPTHQATLLLPLATRHRIHAQDIPTEPIMRNKGDQTGIMYFPSIRVPHKYKWPMPST